MTWVRVVWGRWDVILVWVRIYRYNKKGTAFHGYRWTKSDALKRGRAVSPRWLCMVVNGSTDHYIKTWESLMFGIGIATCNVKRRNEACLLLALTVSRRMGLIGQFESKSKDRRFAGAGWRWCIRRDKNVGCDGVMGFPINFLLFITLSLAAFRCHKTERGYLFLLVLSWKGTSYCVEGWRCGVYSLSLHSLHI